jgi:hypothetical protein
MNDSSELTFFEENDITITDRRAIIGPKTYEIADIISVNMTARGSQSTCLSLLMFPVAIFFLFIGALDGSGNKVVLLPGLLLVVIAIVIAAFAKPEFIVQIRMASGKSNILYSTDKAQIRRVVEAINQAITLSGRSISDRTEGIETTINLWKSGLEGKLIIAGLIVVFWLLLAILGIFLRLWQ